MMLLAEDLTVHACGWGGGLGVNSLPAIRNIGSVVFSLEYNCSPIGLFKNSSKKIPQNKLMNLGIAIYYNICSNVSLCKETLKQYYISYWVDSKKQMNNSNIWYKRF